MLKIIKESSNRIGSIKYTYCNTDANGKPIRLQIDHNTAMREIKDNNLEYKGTVVKDVVNEVIVSTYY